MHTLEVKWDDGASHTTEPDVFKINFVEKHRYACKAWKRDVATVGFWVEDMANESVVSGSRPANPPKSVPNK